MAMERWTEAQAQKLIDIEIVLILAAIGADILIQALASSDWIAAALIVAGFCVILGLYWHTLYLDRLFADLRSVAGHIFSHEPPAAGSAHLDVPASSVADRPIIHVSDFPLSKNFYVRALRPLGYTVTIDLPALSMASLGLGSSSDLWIKGDGPDATMRASFVAAERHMIDEFFDAALEAGGTQDSAPRTRTENGQRAYAASVLDPDGYTIEALFLPASSASSEVQL